MKTFTFYKTPGHGYLKVTKDDLVDVGVADKITDFSFVAKDGAIYLEEDCDFPMFDKAIHDKGATTIEEIRRYTGANTGCGKCIGYINSILDLEVPKVVKKAEPTPRFKLW